MPSRSKKSRKVGVIGVRKDPDFNNKRKKSKAPATPPKAKRHKGNKAGTRNAVETKQGSSKSAKTAQDPRLGSKKPVALIKAPTKAEVKKYATPAEELAALEADVKLSALLDKLDDDKAISAEQQRYVDEKMARHRILCDLLGIVEDEDEDMDDEKDPFSDLDAISLDEFKD